MDFHVGDPVVHWTYGLGEIISLEERVLTGQKTLYYVVQIQDLTVCVPADGKAISRLRSPTPEGDFPNLTVILSSPSDSISDNRLERKTQLLKRLEDGQVEAICRVIRDLFAYQHRMPLNDEDKYILKRALNSLLGEWVFSMSVTRAQAESELRLLLRRSLENTVT